MSTEWILNDQDFKDNRGSRLRQLADGYQKIKRSIVNKEDLFIFFSFFKSRLQIDKPLFKNANTHFYFYCEIAGIYNNNSFHWRLREFSLV